MMTSVATYISKGLGVLATPPPLGGGQLLICCAFAAHACFQVIAYVLRSLSTCLLGLE
jgi:hypothetical protein